ncbi:hypothetical protein HPP92_021242 [Vanilla planifolia]|uniref:Uncharacterized protein n=1 Tax=Vanilla planifolia TaxID=51239 RepID=A0A835Q249_VANPL|nr:hypothetical protein HPP92_021242 [Vanilla planifolia]
MKLSPLHSSSPPSMTLIPKCDPNDGEGTMQLIEDLTANAAQIQRRVLDEILARNSQTEYLRGFLHGHTGHDLFKEKVPIIEYEQMKTYIERIANGESSSIISAQPITELLTRLGIAHSFNHSLHNLSSAAFC